MASPWFVYFAGVGTVVAALGAGFGGGWVLGTSEPAKDVPRTRVQQELAARSAPPPPQPVPVQASDAGKSAERAPEPANDEPARDEPANDPAEPVLTAEERAVPGANWVAMPPPQTQAARGAPRTVSAPVLPITTPLTPPPAQPFAAAPPAAHAPPATDGRASGVSAEEERRALDPRRFRSSRTVDDVEERVPVVQDDGVPAPPRPSPPMRDAGSLRGF